jgi:hypothetical protein
MNPGKKKPKKKRKNPVALPKRDRHGKFVKRRLKKNPAKKAKKKAKAKKASPSRRRRRKKRVVANIIVKANPASRRRRRRAAKANPAAKRRRRRHANPLSKKFRAKAKRTVATLKKRAKKAPKRSLRRRALSAQIRRASAISSLAHSRASAKKIRPAIRGLQHAMMTRSNPGFEGVVQAAKLLAPQAAVGGLGLVGLAMAGKYIADMIVMEKDTAGNAVIKKSFLADEKDPTKGLSALGKYTPALSTAGLSIVGYMVADKVAPRFKGAVMIGGMIGAIVQAVMASVETDTEGKGNWASSVRAALLPVAPAAAPAAEAAGIGEYTTVGAGIFHGLGEYTTVGGGGDNATEFAADSLRGLDDASQFAPGEGGVLSGGIFRE